jgi:hypothetical protein
MSFDPIEIFKLLNRRGVEYIVIGGLAGRLWGSPTMTNDVDICYDRNVANLERLAKALIELNARLRGVDDDVPFILNAETLLKGQNFTFTTRFGSLDVLGLPAGIRRYEELRVNAVPFDFGGVIVNVCELDDLLRMKRAAARPKDLIEIEILSAVREEHDDPDGS